MRKAEARETPTIFAIVHRAAEVCDAGLAWPARPSQAERVHGAGAASEPPEAVPDRLGGDPLRLPGRLERLAAKGQLRGQCRGVGAAGAVRGAAGVALARDLDEPLAVEE